MSSLTYKGTMVAMKLVGYKKRMDAEETEVLAMIREKIRPTDIPRKLYRILRVRRERFHDQLLFTLAPKSGGNGKVILFLHGGAGIMGPMIFHFHTAEKLVRATGYTLYFPFYPLAPEYSCQDGLDWLEQLYQELLFRHPNGNIFFVGDSAGVTLSADICAKAEQKPKGIVMISPPAGFTHQSAQMEAMEKHDPMLTMHQFSITCKLWARDIPFDDPRVHLEKIDFSGFPPMQIFYGTNEIFYPNIQPLLDRIRACDVSPELHEGKGLCHDWPVMDFLPEARRARRQMAAFLAAHSTSGPYHVRSGELASIGRRCP